MLFAITTAASAQTFELLHSFNGTNGSEPYAGLVQARDGNFYGTTYSGGASNLGTVFRMNPSGAVTNLFSFRGTNGAKPIAQLMQASDGVLYGSTFGSVSPISWPGTLFKVTTNGVVTHLRNLTGGGGPIGVQARLIQIATNLFIGTSTLGGTANRGTIFRTGPTGDAFSMYSFDNFSGAYPDTGVTMGSDGIMYGTTRGPSGGIGTVYKWSTPSGGPGVTPIIGFDGTNGSSPSELIQSSSGHFFGTTYGGGSNNLGTIFKVGTNGIGTAVPLVSFGGTNVGANPYAGLVFGGDGQLYGVTYAGGSEDAGTVFKVSTNGTLTTLLSLTAAGGRNPTGKLVYGSDGNFYGTATLGGAHNHGTIFRILMPTVPIPLTTTRSGSSVVIAWSTNATGYTLQTSTNLMSVSTAWTNVSTTPLIQDGQYKVVVSTTGSRRFYRLKR